MKTSIQMNQKSDLIYTSLIAAMREIGAVKKDRMNQSQNYQYRGIEDFVNACHPVFAKHGIFISTTIKDVKREERPTRSGGINIYTNILVSFKFFAQDGSYVESELAGEAMDSGDKSTNKALSAALKYCLAQMLLIPFDMVDSEKDSPEMIQVPLIQQAAKKLETKLDLEPLTIESQYLELLHDMKDQFNKTEMAKLMPKSNWTHETYAKGIQYLNSKKTN